MPVLLRWSQHHSKTETGVRKSRDVCVTIRRPAVIAGGAPTAAAIHVVSTSTRPLRVRHTSGGIRTIPVLTPLPHVANHVIQSPSVRRIASNRRGLAKMDPTRIRDLAEHRVIFALSGEVCLPRMETASKIEGRRCSGPARIFPFCLGRQPIRPIGGNHSRSLFLRRAQRAIVRGIDPAHLFHWIVRAVGAEEARIASANHRDIVGLRHQIFSHVKALADRHEMLDLVRVSQCLVRRAAHGEGAGRYKNHVRRHVRERESPVKSLRIRGQGGIQPQVSCGRQLDDAHRAPAVGLVKVRAGLDRVNAARRAGDGQPGIQLDAENRRRLTRSGINDDEWN